jgi:hypothetical protein
MWLHGESFGKTKIVISHSQEFSISFNLYKCVDVWYFLELFLDLLYVEKVNYYILKTFGP